MFVGETVGSKKRGIKQNERVRCTTCSKYLCPPVSSYGPGQRERLSKNYFLKQTSGGNKKQSEGGMIDWKRRERRGSKAMNSFAKEAWR